MDIIIIIIINIYNNILTLKAFIKKSAVMLSNNKLGIAGER